MPNNPEYDVVDELRTVVFTANIGLATPVNSFKHGYRDELNATLKQMNNPTDMSLKYPLIWVEEPFRVVRGNPAFYGTIELIRLFIINQTDKNWKSDKRRDLNYDPIIKPIYRNLMVGIDRSVAFSTQSENSIQHIYEDVYYWGESQASALIDPVDIRIVTIRNLIIANNPNCTPVGFPGPRPTQPE